jgi:hypothetical protein
MADESQSIRGISWRETFPFTHLFRSFRIAIHPSKLVLGLAALIILFLGGTFLDTIWPVRHRVVPNEVVLYERARRDNSHNFSYLRDNARLAIEANYARMLGRTGLETNYDAALTKAETGEQLGELKKKIVEGRKKRLEDHKKEHDAAVDALRKSDLPKKDDKQRELDNLYRIGVRTIYDESYGDWVNAQKIKNAGVFTEFFDYERAQFNAVIDAVKYANWKAGWDAIKRFLTVGPVWMLTQHPVYFFLFLILFISVWAIFGGAIARIAAVHVARDEKLSIRAALRFSTGKFLSFLFAPIIPLLIVAALGLVITIGALIINIPWLGPILAGLLFFLALAIGFVMTLVLVGTIGGFNLMYPTIAVEGSDSFDAISRSFSYLYARPWRLAFYTAIAIVYGAITYTFLKIFVTLMLTLIHTFAGFGVFRDSDNTRAVWDMMWPGPGELGKLSYDIQTLTLSSGDTLGAYLIAFWVYLVIAILGAFAISFYFSSNTIIYYLMRNEVDATDMDDVFVEQQDDELMEPAPTMTPVTATTAVASEPAGETPSADQAPPPTDQPPAT